MLKAMSLRGSLSTMSAEDVLEWASRRRCTAPVTFERHGIVRTLLVEDGAIACASSNRGDEQLGAILVRTGLLAERALADALEARAQTGVPLGRILLLSGLTTEADLLAILTTKIRETVTEVITWRDGHFDMVPRAKSTVPGVNAQLSIEVCLTVARRRAVRMETIMNILGSDDATFYASPLAVAPPAEPSEVIDPANVWAQATSGENAASIAAALAAERFATYDILANMVQAGQLMIERRHRQRTNSAVELAAGALGRLREGDRTGALAMARQALHQDPNDAEVRAAFAHAERACVADIAKRLLARHRVPTRRGEITEAIRAEHHLTPAEAELAARVDGRWDLMSLIKSASMREADALLAFERLAELGVVELG